jgi:hypothetical protein
VRRFFPENTQYATFCGLFGSPKWAYLTLVLPQRFPQNLPKEIEQKSRHFKIRSINVQIGYVEIQGYIAVNCGTKRCNPAIILVGKNRAGNYQKLQQLSKSEKRKCS